jgi:tol-pal system protein YbgF
MKKTLLFVSFVCGATLSVPGAQARDIQLRDSGDNTSLAPATAPRTATTDLQKLTPEERLTRLERILNSQGLVDMLSRMDNLQTQIEKLRGDIEIQSHQLEEIKQRQRDLYVDIDRRLLRLERNAPSSSGLGAGAKTSIGPSPSQSPGAGTSHTATVATQTTASRSPTVSSGTQTASADSAGEQQAYQKAFDTLRALRYDQAVTAFKGFLAKYPKGRYAHIAQYWIGEADYAQRKFKLAIGDYQKLIDDYPTSPKLAEAMLKIGYSQYELKNNKAAETILKQLIKSYPGTTEAGQAQNLLQKIRLNR